MSLITAEELKFAEILSRYKKRFECDLPRFLETLGPPGTVRSAAEYSLNSSGKRLRPALIYLIADELGNGCDVAPAAASVEFLHKATLISDDLPCIDNDDMRQGQPTCHKAFGVATAVLASYSCSQQLMSWSQ